MSRLQIQTYYKNLDNLIQRGGSKNEQSIRGAKEGETFIYSEALTKLAFAAIFMAI